MVEALEKQSVGEGQGAHPGLEAECEPEEVPEIAPAYQSCPTAT